MNCSTYTLAGLNVGCKDSMGGIKEVYIANYSDITNITTSEGKITAISLPTSTKFKTFKFRKNTGALTSSLQTSETAGNFFQNELTLQFMKMETNKRLQMMALLMGECVVIVKDVNGKYWYLGFDNPVEATAGTAQTGTGAGDLNGYDLTLTDQSKELPYEVDASAVESIIEPAPVSAE